MKRKSRKKANPFIEKNEFVLEDFVSSCNIIQYSKENFATKQPKNLDELVLRSKNEDVTWLNIYGFQHMDAIVKIVTNNKLDEFLINLIKENNHRNKVIELSDCFFLTLKSPYYSKEESETKFEQMVFVVGTDFVWSIQEVKGDHFEHLRERLKNNYGVIRSKDADYLFYLLVEAIIDNYYTVYDEFSTLNIDLNNLGDTKPTPEFALKIENSRKHLNQIKKMTSSIKDAIYQLESVDCIDFNLKYFIELKEQISLMNDEIDFNLNQLESSINLIFSMQSHRLNEVMKTLTIFSVIFIPLTFLAGIYGMNFKNMPELESNYGYFILIGIMFIITILSIFFIKKKKW